MALFFNRHWVRLEIAVEMLFTMVVAFFNGFFNSCNCSNQLNTSYLLSTSSLPSILLLEADIK